MSSLLGNEAHLDTTVFKGRLNGCQDTETCLKPNIWEYEWKSFILAVEKRQ